MDLSSQSSALVGVVTPLLVGLLRQHLLPWKGRAAFWLSFAVAAGCVGAAYLGEEPHPTLLGFLTNLGLAFSLQQIVYQHLSEAVGGPAQLRA